MSEETKTTLTSTQWRTTPHQRNTRAHAEQERLGRRSFIFHLLISVINNHEEPLWEVKNSQKSFHSAFASLQMTSMCFKGKKEFKHFLKAFEHGTYKRKSLPAFCQRRLLWDLFLSIVFCQHVVLIAGWRLLIGITRECWDYWALKLQMRMKNMIENRKIEVKLSFSNLKIIWNKFLLTLKCLSYYFRLKFLLIIGSNFKERWKGVLNLKIHKNTSWTSNRWCCRRRNLQKANPFCNSDLWCNKYLSLIKSALSESFYPYPIPWRCDTFETGANFVLFKPSFQVQFSKRQ